MAQVRTVLPVHSVSDLSGSYRREYPETLAPILWSQKDNHVPLNPVCPVMRTFLSRQNSGFGFATFSKARLLSVKVLPVAFSHDEYQCAAKSHRV